MGCRIFLARAVVCAVALTIPSLAAAAEYFVSQGARGSGTSAAPFGRIQDALNVAQPGDIVTVRPGTYAESIRTIRSGSATRPIALRAEGPRGSAVVTAAGRVLRVDHAYVLVQGLVLDGQYGAADTVDVNTGGHYLTLRDVEVRRSSRDLIDIGSPQGLVIERALIHHALNAANGRTDAHGIAAGAVRNLTIRDTEIHTFSGDGIQVDPGRSSPGWSNVTIERTRIWLAPLPAATNGFPAGTVAGENALDTKASASYPRARLVLRDVTAWGFGGGLISNMAAFNLKEFIQATVDRVTVYDSEIAFRVRGGGSSDTGAWVTISNALVYDTATAVRYEDNVRNLNVWNTTVGANVARAFRAASSNANGIQARNVLVLGSLPAEAAHSSNLAVSAGAFVNAGADDYRLAPGSPAIDAGSTLSAVTMDRAGLSRPQGGAYDVGAYEYAASVAPAPPAPTTPTSPTPPPTGEVVIHATNASKLAGGWRVFPDGTAASGERVSHPDQGAAKLSVRSAPTHYFEVQAWVEAGVPYRLWMRGRAENDDVNNDSVYVQFSNSLTTSGTPIYRIGTTSAVTFVLHDCTGCALAGWGWQDTAAGAGVLGPLVTFATTGYQTVRIQTREDGFSIDQIVLSPSQYLSKSPGAPRNDTTILPGS